ncbi:hypothetical protein BJF78_04210 [Pseudonocardia sp. CNS-139]|nr:hypothetical protein BJF78_04210 [Pseudonocardia sp. CNS-139]
MFPVSLRRVPDPLGLLASFCDADLPVAGPDEQSRWVAEGARFVAHLQQHATPDVAEPARLEWLRAELLHDGAATAAAARAADPGRTPRAGLGARVRVATFAVDVTAAGRTPAGEPLPARPVHLLLRRAFPASSVAVFGLDGPTYDLLVRRRDTGDGPTGTGAAVAAAVHRLVEHERLGDF